MDPLAILKDFCKSGQLDHVILDGERVKFADKYSFPKQTPTAFRAKDGTGDFYSLEAVSFFIKTIIADANMGNYVLKAVSTKAEQIEVRDRQVGAGINVHDGGWGCSTGGRAGRVGD